MSTAADSRFTRRQNKDGSHDSICAACLATVVTLHDADDLPRHESVHICDPIRLYQLGKLLTRDQPNPTDRGQRL